MRVFLAITFVLALAVAVNAAPDTQQNDAQAAIDKVMADLKDTFAELSVIDESDKTLEMSNRAQIETNEMLNRRENRIKHEDIPALQQRSDLHDQKRQEYIDSGCPVYGGTVPIDVYERCNPSNEANNREYDDILLEAQHIKEQLESIAETRQAVSDTTLANAQKQKANNAKRAELMAKQAELKSQLIRLAINASSDKARAVNACNSLSGEQAHCCHSVVSDGTNPQQCGVELIYKVLENAGIFSTTTIIAQ